MRAVVTGAAEVPEYRVRTPPTAWAPVVADADAELERAWVRRTADGDEAAFALLCERFRPTCRAVARRVLSGGDHVEDVVQAVLLDVWRQAGRYDPARAKVGSWVSAIAHNKAVDVIRCEEQHRRRRTGEKALDGHEDPGPRPEDAFLLAREREQVRVALAGLPLAQREVLVLAYYGGRSYREIAVTVQAPLGTVKSRGFNGLLSLRRALTEAAEA